MRMLLGSLVGINAMDVRDYTYYDRLRIPPPTVVDTWEVPARCELFQLPSGQRDPFTSAYKTLTDTNMWLSGRLPSPRQFRVDRLFFLFDPRMAVADRERLTAGYVYELEVGSKIRHRGPLLRFPTVGDIKDFCDFDTPDPGDPILYKHCRRTGLKIEPPFCVNFEIPLVIESEMSFCVALVGTPFFVSAGGSGVSLWACLDGLGAFAVQ